MTKVVCIGGGPAGLTAAYVLGSNQCEVIVLEADSEYVGGIARTVQRDGFCFDIGGHRFFSKSSEITALWKEILGDDLRTCKRKSSIYYGGKFYPYPLDLHTTLTNLGISESLRCGLSYLWANIFSCRNPQNFEQWVTNKFGARLFRIFFKTYTEKIWGMPCSEISADWAAQRIKGLSFLAAFLDTIARAMGIKRDTKCAKSLIDSFLYPRKGPGMMWEAAAQKITALGGKIHLGSRVTSLSYNTQSRQWHVRYENSNNGAEEVIEADHVISSMPLKELAHAVEGAPRQVLEAADALRYRDFLIVALILSKDTVMFEDNWLYIHDAGVKVGRIQNFKAWSEAMVPADGRICYGMEYFCNEADALWSESDEALIQFAAVELTRIGLANVSDVQGGYVVRQPKAYPVYDKDYQEHIQVIRSWLELYPHLQVVGRNGMHKYNNQDHSMMTAILAARNILAGNQQFDLWNVNQDAEYHEESASRR